MSSILLDVGYFAPAMIRKLTFSNFCSFAEEAEMDFTASASLSTDNSFVYSQSGDQITTLAGVFGPNGAGKTTLLKALSFVYYFMRHTYKDLAEGDRIPLDPFISRSAKPSFFKIEFEGSLARYRYEFSIQDSQITGERLSRYYSKTKSFRTLLVRRTTKSGKPSISQPSPFTDLSVLKKLIKERPNSSLLSAGLLTGRKEFKAVINEFGPQASNVGREGKKEHMFQESERQIFEISEFFYEHNEYLEDLVDLLKSSDVGISDLEIKKVPGMGADNKPEDVYVPALKHRGPDGDFTLTMFEESSGTKRLFMLFAAFLPIIKHGGTAVIDEMESDLHPHIIPVILDLFADPQINTKQAQLVFTCHHVEILNHLAKEQITFVNKDENCVSEAYRLSDVAGVRREENFFSNYNAGRYDAVPEPSLF